MYHVEFFFCTFFLLYYATASNITQLENWLNAQSWNQEFHAFCKLELGRLQSFSCWWADAPNAGADLEPFSLLIALPLIYLYPLPCYTNFNLFGQKTFPLRWYLFSFFGAFNIDSYHSYKMVLLLLTTDLKPLRKSCWAKTSLFLWAPLWLDSCGSGGSYRFLS